MREVDMCGLPYVRNGDVTDCRLHFNHSLDCEQANRQAFLESLRTRQWQAHTEGPWL